MNYKEVISSGLLESYVLGHTTAEESAMISKLSKEHPELLAEIEAIEASLLRYAESHAPSLNSGLKEKIRNSLNAEETKVIAINSNKDNKGTSLYKFGMAASILLFISSLAYNILLQQKIKELQADYNEINSTRTYLSEEIKNQNIYIATLNEKIQVIANPVIKTIALEGKNSLQGNSALVHWNEKTNEVYFNASDLPAAPQDKQYQLWAIVDGKPVDAGMVEVGKDSVFQKMKTIKGAQAFAVTIEKRGGSASPTMETMCLLGNV